MPGMKGKKKLPEPAPRALQSRGAGAGDARAQPPAPGAQLRSVEHDPAGGPTRDQGDDEGKAEGGPGGPGWDAGPDWGFLGSLFPRPAPGRRVLPAASRRMLRCPLAARPSTRRLPGELPREPAAQLTISGEAWRSEKR